ncbi:MAG: tetratricopeptide repeat protein [Anaerolineales bacterium]|nr:tetratricopeptide repeat protein [Anaerolineales bacterium]
MTLSEYILDVSEATFENEVLIRSHEVPVVVDFWASWCGPCRVLSPLLERLAIEGGGSFLLAKVDVDENPGLSIRYGVQGIPTVKAFRNGEVRAEFVGAQPEPIVRRFIQNLVPSEAETAVEEAQSLLATRHWSDAEDAFRTVFREDDSNAPAALGLVKSLLMQGRGQEVTQILNNFPPGTQWADAERLRPLAQLLADVEENGPYPEDDPLDARLYQSARLIARDNLPAALDGLLDVLREDKNFRGGLPKQVMLAIFALLGDQDPLTRQYRDELASVLF